ncbi:MAG: RNA polymerase sigma factor [Candidatus Nealsonbacteria bacterium]|nr:RNA polymerase sigma factor [Candidatus Nealsonbacteria bacterium]
MGNQKEEFSKIYDQYVEKIYRFVFLKVNSKDVAEDLCSEVFTRCWKTFTTGNQNPIDNVQAFLYQIARNLVIDHYREKGKAQIVSTDSVPIIDTRTSFEEWMNKKSDLETIRKALANINDDYQNMVIWHYIDDLSIPEIAVMTEKSEGAVRTCLSRALGDLRAQFEEA